MLPSQMHNGRHVVSLTANIHEMTLGEASQKLSQALRPAGNPPKGVSVELHGEIPPLEQTLSGLRTGVFLAVLVIFLLLTANFQSVRLALSIVLTNPAVLCGALLMLFATGNHAEHSIVHGSDHGNWNRRCQLHLVGELRRAFPAWGKFRPSICAGGREQPLASDPHYGCGHDFWHDTDGDRLQ